MNNQVLDKILVQLNHITKEQQEMKKDIASISKEQREMKQDIAEIKKDTKDISAMKVAVLETNNRVKKIETKLDKHERTLDLLSRRSIDQEAELKSIK